jgi:YcxB-like protein
MTSRYNAQPMEISYQLTVEDYRQGFIACRKRTSFSRWLRRFAYLCLGVSVVFLIVLLGFGERKTFGFMAPLYLLVLLWIYILWFNPYLVSRKLMRGSPTAQAIHTVDFSEAGIHSRNSLSETTLEWGSLVDWKEARGVFALFLSPISFFPVPKRAMTETQLEEFRNLLAAKVGKH